MKEDLITFETAKLAKQKEFDVEVEFYYTYEQVRDSFSIKRDFNYSEVISKNHNNKKESHEVWTDGVRIYNSYSSPTQSLLQKWLRETKDIHAEVLSHKYKTKELRAVPRSYQSIVDGDYFESFDSHYEAVENSLTRSLKKL